MHGDFDMRWNVKLFCPFWPVYRKNMQNLRLYDFFCHETRN